MRYFYKIAVLFTVALSVNAYSQEAKTEISQERINNLSKKIVGWTARLGDGTNKVSMDWNSNPEVAEIAGYPDEKRLAAILSLIQILQKNDGKIFPDYKTNADENGLILVNRISEYSYVKTLLRNNPDDHLLTEYFDNEIEDLKFVQNVQLPVYLYGQLNDARINRLLILYSQNKSFLEQMLKMQVDKSSTVNTLGNKTTGLVLINTCIANVEPCEKLK